MDQSADEGARNRDRQAPRFAERREIVGHSQETLAPLVGVEPTTVGRWERAETCPQPWCRPKLADALSVSIEELDTMLTEEQTAKQLGATGEQRAAHSGGD